MLQHNSIHGRTGFKVNKKPLGLQATSQKDRRLWERLANIDFEDALVETSRDSKPKLPAHGIVVKTEKELDNALHSHPCLMTATPANRKKVIKAWKNAPGAHLLREGEVWAMVDSGACVSTSIALSCATNSVRRPTNSSVLQPMDGKWSSTRRLNPTLSSMAKL